MAFVLSRPAIDLLEGCSGKDSSSLHIWRWTKAFTAAAVISLIGATGFCALWPKSVSAFSPHYFDRVVIIVLENYRSDKVDPSAIGPEQFTPFLNKLARENRLQLNYFGIGRPSL